MAYNKISSRRIPYDIDGTEIGHTSFQREVIDFIEGPRIWATSEDKMNLQDQNSYARFADKDNANLNTRRISLGNPNGVWFFFPEKTEVTHVSIPVDSFENNNDSIARVKIEGSNNTTNGLDGDWETATQKVTFSLYKDHWRRHIDAVSFSSPVKTLRVMLYTNHMSIDFYPNAIHLYGFKAEGEQENDILFCNESGEELKELLDFGDRPEGTTEIKSFKLENSSKNKTANNINLQLNDEDFLISFEKGGPWTSVLDIDAIPANGYSTTIYIKNELKPPLLKLGPRVARIIVSVRKWG